MGLPPRIYSQTSREPDVAQTERVECEKNLPHLESMWNGVLASWGGSEMAQQHESRMSSSLTVNGYCTLTTCKEKPHGMAG